MSLFFISAQEYEESYSNNRVFLGLGVKGNVYVNDNAVNGKDVWNSPTLAGDLFLGKWFGDKVGGRIAFEGGQLKPTFKNAKLETKEGFVLGRVDLLLNLTNCFREYTPDRVYDLSPYIGIGGAHAFNAENRPDKATGSSSFVFGGGLMNSFRLSNNLSAYINLGMNIVDAKFDGYKNARSFNGIASGSIGLVINFGKSTRREYSSPPPDEEYQSRQAQWQRRQSQTNSRPVTSNRSAFEPEYESEFVSEYVPQPEPRREVYREPQPDPQSEIRVEPQPEPRSEIILEPQAQPQQKAQPQPQRKAQPAAKAKPFRENVFFRFEKSVVDPGQNKRIESAANFLKANPKAKLTIVGYADKKTGSAKFNMALSEQRAKSVAKVLVDKYKIKSNRLNVQWKGDKVQPYKTNALNRVVILKQ